MPEYLSPGVYVEEVSSGAKPIEGVSTSTAGFFGPTQRGPQAVKMVTSWLDYQRWFGSYTSVPAPAMLPFAAEGFFANGGQRLFVARVVGTDAKASAITGAAGSLDLDAIGPGLWGDQVVVVLQNNPAAKEDDAGAFPEDAPFDVSVNFFATKEEATTATTEINGDEGKTKIQPESQEQFNGVTVLANSPNGVFNVLQTKSKLITMETAPTTRPTLTGSTKVAVQLDGGDNGTLPLELANFVGSDPDPAKATGLTALGMVDDISILACPDAANNDTSVVAATVYDALVPAMVAQCENLGDRFVVVDSKAGETTPTNLRPPIDTTYGGFYYPWIRVFDPKSSRPQLIPPSGSVVGVYARTDVDRGVWKAPANEVVRNLYLGGDGPLELSIDKGNQDILNPRGVNVIRDFRNLGRDVRIWGARTMSSDPEWRYVNVRRLFIYVEESIDQGTQWVVFEPNDPPTWTRVVASISGFLNTLWRDGGLMGTTPQEAFFVVCDRTTMTQDDIDNGRLICNVGIAPVKPAEFVIIRIGQKTMEAG